MASKTRTGQGVSESGMLENIEFSYKTDGFLTESLSSRKIDNLQYDVFHNHMYVFKLVAHPFHLNVSGGKLQTK